MRVDLFPIKGGYLMFKDGARFRAFGTRQMKKVYRLLPDDADIVMHPKGHAYAELGTADFDQFPGSLSEMSLAEHAEMAKPVSEKDLLR